MPGRSIFSGFKPKPENCKLILLGDLQTFSRTFLNNLYLLELRLYFVDSFEEASDSCMDDGKVCVFIVPMEMMNLIIEAPETPVILYTDQKHVALHQQLSSRRDIHGVLNHNFEIDSIQLVLLLALKLWHSESKLLHMENQIDTNNARVMYQNLVLDSLDKIVIVLKPDLTVISMNRKGYELLGPQEITHGKPVFSLQNLNRYPKDHPSCIAKDLLRRNSKVATVNSRKWYITSIPVLDIGGEELHFLIEIWENCTDRAHIMQDSENAVLNKKSKAPLFDSLTDREYQILPYVARGMKYSDIADEINISINTVKTHMRNIFRKLSCQNRNQLMRLLSNRQI
ncbi:helix-turn-helix domain-containing protein [Spirochaeta dissipatitropha]